MHTEGQTQAAGTASGQQAEVAANSPYVNDAPYANAVSAMMDDHELESKKSHRVITTSLMIYQIYLIGMAMIYIGYLNYYDTRLDIYESNYSDSTIDRYNDAIDTYSWFQSGIVFIIIGVLAQIYDWHTNVSCKTLYGDSGNRSKLCYVACALLFIGAILNVVGMFEFVDYVYGDDDTSEYTDADWEDRTIREMWYWGFFIAASLWSMHFISFYFIGKYQLNRLISSNIIFVLQCVLMAPFFGDLSNTYGNYDSDSSSDDSGEYERWATEFGLVCAGLIAMAALSVIMVLLCLAIKVSVTITNKQHINGTGYETYFRVWAILFCVAFVIFLAGWAAGREGYVLYEWYFYTMPVVYGPMAIVNDVYSSRWTF